MSRVYLLETTSFQHDTRKYHLTAAVVIKIKPSHGKIVNFAKVFNKDNIANILTMLF